MSNAVEKVLVIGGGFSGMSAAIELRKRGIEVDLVEIDPEWRSYGAGISLGGATLRAFRTLGILEEFLEKGARRPTPHRYICPMVRFWRPCRRRASPVPTFPAAVQSCVRF